MDNEREVKKMNIEYNDNCIYVNDGEKHVGYIKYQPVSAQVIDVITTYVDDHYRGQGIAGKLFEQLVLFARENHYQIVPSCSYIRKKLESSTDYHDIYVKY